MIRVSKIAHASYETPDLVQQTEYNRHSRAHPRQQGQRHRLSRLHGRSSFIVVLKARRRNACGSGFRSASDVDLGDFESQVPDHGIQTERKSDPEPSISDMLVFTIPRAR